MSQEIKKLLNSLETSIILENKKIFTYESSIYERNQ